MEEDQGVKHMCKLCDKNFPCGRSLGGHMRSHVIYPTDQEKLHKIKKLLPPLTNSPFVDVAGYGLSENPKKACKFQDLSQDTLLHDKFCRECCKAFSSWKALFGHMKCHSDKFALTRVEGQDSWTSADQSDNRRTNPKKKRSSRSAKRYSSMDITANSASSSLSFNANASSSVSEIEQEQEEVAMCLIMLSKDVTHWGGLNFAGESSDNKSDFIETETCAATEEDRTKRTEGSEAQLVDLIVDKKLKRSTVVEESDLQLSEEQMTTILIKKSECDDQKGEMGTAKKQKNLSKRKGLHLVGTESGMDSEMCKEIGLGKKGKFECTSCNKGFNTFQALGGHRASHKKMKGCFGLKPNNDENSITKTDHILSPTPNGNKTSPIDQEMARDATTNGTTKIHKEGPHKCPICFRVFSSGQALGGHKRAHLLAEVKSNQTSTSIVNKKPILEIRDFLDLNLPAPDEEDSNISVLEFNTWWIGAHPKHEPLLGPL